MIIDDLAIQQNALAYIKHCIDACHTIGATNLNPSIYAAVGRTWQQNADAREKDMQTLIKHLKFLSRVCP